MVQVKPPSDLAVDQAVGNQLEHLDPAVGEFREEAGGLPVGRRDGEEGECFAGQASAEHHLSGCDGSDSTLDLLLIGALTR